MGFFLSFLSFSKEAETSGGGRGRHYQVTTLDLSWIQLISALLISADLSWIQLISALFFSLDFDSLASAGSIPPDKTQLLAFYDALLPFYDIVCIRTGLQAKIAQKRLKSILDQLESTVLSLPD